MDPLARRLDRGIDLMGLDKEISARIAATKRRLMEGGLLQEVQWGVPGPRIGVGLDARLSFTWKPLFVYIRSQQGIARGRSDTNRVDSTLVVVLDEVAIDTSDRFQWGEPPHVYKIKSVSGFIRDEDRGTRYASEVTVQR